MCLYSQTMEDWEEYVRVETQSEWSEEARSRLESVKDNVNLHNQSMSDPLLTPPQIANASDTNLPITLDQRIEEYLSLATTEWLPKAYPIRHIQTADVDNSRLALQIVARVLNQKHGDTWLEELLSGASSPTFSHAVEHLSLAVEANEVGNNVLGLRHSREAEVLFRSIGNSAGVSRAEVESIFAAHDAQDGNACSDAVNKTSISRNSYRWLTVDFHIEQGTCRGFAGDLGAMRRLYRQAADEAEAAEYSVIYLRTQDHLSHLDSQDGALTEGWTRNQTALALFWSGKYPPMRGYNLYLNLYEFAGVNVQPYLQMTVCRDAVALSDHLADNVIRAMAHSLMGNAAVAAEQAGIAERAFTLSSALFAQAPQIKSTRTAQIEAETRLAELWISEGNAQSAVERLRRYALEVAQLSDNYLGILYQAALGKAEATAGNDPEA